MNRLTYRPDNGLEEIVYLNPADPEGSYDILDLAKYADAGDGMEAQVLLKISARLFAYEDTGLSPEEIEQLRSELKTLKATIAAFDGETEPSAEVIEFLKNETELRQWIKRCAWHCRKVHDLNVELEQVKAERDAAVEARA